MKTWVRNETEVGNNPWSATGSPPWLKLAPSSPDTVGVGDTPADYLLLCLCWVLTATQHQYIFTVTKNKYQLCIILLMLCTYVYRRGRFPSCPGGHRIHTRQRILQSSYGTIFSVHIFSKKAWLIHSIPALAHKVTAVTFYKALPNLFNCWSNWRYNWREVM